MKKLNQDEVYLVANQLLVPKTLAQICFALKVNVYQVMALSIYKKYTKFSIPKGNNEFRIIEYPEDDLMTILKRFNFHLQASYYLHQTKAAYGFMLGVRNEPKPKNILENAKRHLGNSYMLKIDLKDFFHQIKIQRVQNILKNKPFNFNNSTTHTLSHLFTYNNRLPMGSPTSPAISNFATIELDNNLDYWANKNKVAYTRFADDMTFSTNNKSFTDTDLDQITTICTKNNYQLKDSKTTFYQKKDTKIVTGLLLNEKVSVQENFYEELDKDLVRLKSLVEIIIITKEKYKNTTLLNFKQEIQGKINFIGMIEGYYGKNYKKYLTSFKQIIKPNSEQLFSRWTHFNYF